MKKIFIIIFFVMLIAGHSYADEKKYIPLDDRVVCELNTEFDWIYDCNQCPDGYFVRSLHHRFVDQEGKDVRLQVKTAECSKPILDRPFKTITELNQIGDGEYNTEGYVVWKNEPWDCPEGEACEQWIPEIVIAQLFQGAIKEIDRSGLKEDELLMSAEFFHMYGHENIKVGERYRFSVKKYFTEKFGGYYSGIGFELIQ